ncbi:MAG: SDR family oxidoreductase [Myxococcota bacterium]
MVEERKSRRRALVTGATRGIGKAIACELASAGFDVAFTGRTRREGEGAEEDDFGRPTPLPGSLETTRALVDAAGGQALPLALVKAFLPGMVEAGRGVVIDLSTRHNYTRQAGPPGRGGAGVSYNGSKAALGKLADGLAAEHGRDGVLAFDLDPGPVWTERGERQHERIGYPRSIFRPIEVPARVVRWLATDPEAARYNGQHFMAQAFVRARGLYPPWETTLRMNERWSTTAILDWRERGRPR